MASPYTTEDEIGLLAGDDVRDVLADFDDDGAPDDDVIATAITRGDRKIDARLGRRYQTPFDDLPNTPGLIQTISTHLAIVELLSQRHSDGVDIEYHLDQAEELLKGILEGTYHLDATQLDPDERSVTVAFDQGDPTFAGVDANGRSNMDRW